MNANVVALPVRPDLWRGRRSLAPIPATPTGHAALDALLPGRGWPVGALCEILHAAEGVGELALVLPALARLAEGERPVAWVAPPHRLYAPALRRLGVPPSAIRVIEAAEERQALWAAEQCLRAGCCAAVLAWPRRIDGTGLRRLQLAAEAGRCHGFLFRDLRHAVQASPAPLRLAVRREHGELRLRVHKCRGLLNPPIDEVPLA